VLNILYWVKTPNTLLNISQMFYFQLPVLSLVNSMHVEGITQGKDWWHVFEISWLNHLGLPQVAIGRLTLPANSPT
jgi:NADPH-dependent 7-cyano-7-deazaguanine reductase QueF-like protein